MIHDKKMRETILHTIDKEKKIIRCMNNKLNKIYIDQKRRK